MTIPAVTVVPVPSPAMVIKGSKMRLHLTPEQRARRAAGGQAGTGKSKVRSPEALAAAVAARIEANKARKHAVDVELPALRAEVVTLRAEVAALKAKLRERG